MGPCARLGRPQPFHGRDFIISKYRGVLNGSIRGDLSSRPILHIHASYTYTNYPYPYSLDKGPSVLRSIASALLPARISFPYAGRTHPSTRHDWTSSQCKQAAPFQLRTPSCLKQTYAPPSHEGRADCLHATFPPGSACTQPHGTTPGIVTLHVNESRPR